MALGIVALSATPYRITPINSVQAATGSGLVQLWQEIPEGQRKPKNVSEAELKEKLYCKVNHELIAGQGINQFDTYVNSCYVDDAYYLDETNGSYKILVSGYEGWVSKSQEKTVSLQFYVDKNEREVPTSRDGQWKTYHFTVKTVARFIPLDENETPNVPSGAKQQSSDDYLKSADDFKEDASLFSKIGGWLGLRKDELTVQSPSFYTSENGTLVHYISKGVTKENNYSSVVIGKAPRWMKDGKAYYSYDGIYFYDDLTNIDVFGEGAVNETEPFFNYYQYVPIRSISNLTVNDMDYYIKQKGYTAKPTKYPAGGNQSQLYNEGASFLNAQAKYHINGALQLAMGIHESGWGRSSLSVNKNNLFGMNAVDLNPTQQATSFTSPAQAIDYHAERYLSWGYSDPLGDSRYHGFYLGNKSGGMNVKYASDPFWGEKIAGHYYNLDKLSGYRDYDSTSFGVIMYEEGTPIYQEADTHSTVLYRTKNGKTGTSIPYYPVIITGEVEGFYRILLDTPIGANGMPAYDVTYTGKNEVGYIPKEAVHYLNTGEAIGTPTKTPSTYKPSDSIITNQTTGSGTMNHQNESSGYVLGSSGISLEGQEATKTGKVLIDALSVRTEPSAKGNVIGRLSKNQEIQVLGQEGKWMMFDFQGELAYVSSAYVAVDKGAEQEVKNQEAVNTPNQRVNGVARVSEHKPVIEIGYVTTKALNVRAEASVDGNEIGAVYQGDKVEIVGQKGAFYEINYKNGTGFVSSQYISMSPVSSPDEEPDKPSHEDEEIDIPTVVIKLGYVSTNGIYLNVFKSPSSNSASQILGALADGTEVEILKDMGQTYMIKYNGGVGYVEKASISNKKPSTSSSNKPNSSTEDSNNSNQSTKPDKEEENPSQVTPSPKPDNDSSTTDEPIEEGSQTVEDWFSNTLNGSSSQDAEEIDYPNEEGDIFEPLNDLGDVAYHFVQARLQEGALVLIGRVNPSVSSLMRDPLVEKNFLIVDSNLRQVVKRVPLSYQAATDLLLEGDDALKFELAFPLQKLPNGVYELKMALSKGEQESTTAIYDEKLVGYKIVHENRLYRIDEVLSSSNEKTLQLVVVDFNGDLNEIYTPEMNPDSETVDEVEENVPNKEESKGFFSSMVDGLKDFFSNLMNNLLNLFGLADKEGVQDMSHLQENEEISSEEESEISADAE